MLSYVRGDNLRPISNRHTYPQFTIDQQTGRISVNLIDRESGQIVSHISAKELNKIIRAYCTGRGIKYPGSAKG